MSTSTMKKRVAFGLAALSVGAALATSSGSASADPTQLSAFVGVGSDTTQDVMNAMSGFNFGKEYLAVNSGAATAFKHLISFNAAPVQTAGDNCMTPVINGPTFTRPNGSGAGRKALAAANGSATGWLGSTFTKDDGTVLPTCGTTAKNLAGAVQFARSSSLSGDTSASDVVFIPFGKDAVTYASYRPGGGAPLTTLTRQQLISVYASATRVTVPDPDGSGTLTIIPCGVQTSSGTMTFFRDTVTKSTATEATAVLECTPTSALRIQESKGDLLKQRGDTLLAGGKTDFVVISAYAASAYIAQANGLSEANGVADITLGGISDDSETTGGANLGSPVQGTAPALTPNSTFYDSAATGRFVYNVVKKTNILNASNVPLNNAYNSLFGVGGAVCSNTAVINSFGFATIATCGDTSRLRKYEASAS